MARMIRPTQKSPRWASFLALAALACFVVWMVACVRTAKVPSGSMEPTLVPGDVLLMRIDAYRHSKPDRGDLIIFHDKTHDGELLVKRVIGLPNEDLFIQGGIVWVNGRLLEEPYTETPFISREHGNVKLKADQYWVMGDNRTKSEDSRDFGPIEPDQFVGRAAAIIWPVSRRGKIPSYHDAKRGNDRADAAGITSAIPSS